MDWLNELEPVMQYITLYGPSVVSVLGVIGAVIAAVFKIKSAIANNQTKNDEVIEQLTLFNKRQADELSIIRRENAQLKKDNREIKQIITRIQPKESKDETVFKVH